MTTINVNLNPCTTSHHQRSNYPSERGRGAPHPDELSTDTRTSVDRTWRDAEAAEKRARAATLATYDNLKNKGGE